MQKSQNDKIIPDKIRGVFAGIASGIFKTLVGHPLDTIKIRLQYEGLHGRFEGPIDCLIKTFKFEGIKGLYKGVLLPLIAWPIVDLVMFGVYKELRLQFQQQIVQNQDDHLDLYYVFLCGLGAGIVSTIPACPMEQIKSRLQVQYTQTQYKGPVDCALQLYQNNGFQGFYKGYISLLICRCFSAVYFGSYEIYKRQTSSWSQIPEQLKNFVCGGCAASTTFILSLPFDTIKNKIMSQKDSQNRQYKSFIDCMKQTYKKDGIPGFYQGFYPGMLRAFPANGAAFLAVELTLKYLP